MGRLDPHSTPSAVSPGDASPAVLLLHINDNTDDQILFQAACRQAGLPFNWHVIDSAEKGINYLDSLLELGKCYEVCWPNLVVLDIVLPVKSGFEVLKHIRRTPALDHLPVVILTGTGDTYSKVARRLGANAFLEKPLEFDQTVKVAKHIYDMWKANDWSLQMSN